MVSKKPPGSAGFGRIQSDTSRHTIPKVHQSSTFSANDSDKSPDFHPLALKLRQSIDSSTTKGSGSSISVYFRDLDTGRWTGVNENDTYAPASILKVVAMMAVLKMTEENPDILSRMIYYKPDEATKFYRPKGNMKEGYRSIQDLLYNMIVYSDNASGDALMSDKDAHGAFNFVYSLFRLPEVESTISTNTEFMSAKSYSSVFRGLYNSSLFQWHLSEQALELLSKTDFPDGLVAGVPAGTRVSHKFGETGSELEDKTVMHQLHDCGIVYYPGHPYLLCVMTKGKDFSKLTSIISDISRLTWDFVSGQYKQ